MRAIQLIIFIAVFAGYLGFIATSGGIEVLVSGDPEALGTPPLETESCDIGGLDALVDVAVCAIDNIAFYTNLVFIESQYHVLNALIFIPLGLALGYIIITVIRGGGAD